MISEAVMLNVIISGFLLLLVYLSDRWEKEPMFHFCFIYLASIFAT